MEYRIWVFDGNISCDLLLNHSLRHLYPHTKMKASMMMRQIPMNNTPATKASSSFVCLLFFIFVLPLFRPHRLQISLRSVLWSVRGAHISNGWSELLWFAPFTHRTTFADSQTPCLFIDTHPLCRLSTPTQWAWGMMRRFADFPALRHKSLSCFGNEQPTNIEARMLRTMNKTHHERCWTEIQMIDL